LLVNARLIAKFTPPQFGFIHITKEKFYDRCKKTSQSNGYSRIAIVTDASSGIGEATPIRFIASGYGVIGNARNAEKLSALEKELGQKALACSGMNRVL
jgi:hypothetical protein